MTEIEAMGPGVNPWAIHEWFSHPGVIAMLDRAHRYRHEVYTTTGRLPERFMVSEREYDLLQTCRDPNFVPVHGDSWQSSGIDPVSMQIFGMKVCRHERFPWYQDNQYMEHFRMSALNQRPIQVWDPLPCAPMELERCRTELPSTSQREVTCPCGEVIWDISPAFQFDRRQEVFARAVRDGILVDGRLVARQPRRDDDPLPPLDDLDEGCQCRSCNRHFETFAAYMAHVRKHDEG